MPAISLQDMQDLDSPLMETFGLQVVDIGEGEAVVKLPYKDLFGRPGGTVNGPSMMCLADFGMYVATMSLIGPRWEIVTATLNSNFLRRPRPVDIIGYAKVLKLGKRLAYGTVELFSVGDEQGGPVAHMTCSYSIP